MAIYLAHLWLKQYAMKYRLASLSFAAVMLWLAVVSFTNSSVPEEKPRNIILMIGDGMGLSQLSSAFYYGNGEPNFARFPIVGLSRTSASSDKITDSAAGATALSTGKKTYNGAIGVDAKKKSVETLIEYFAAKGLSNGLVATSSITHATPASFYAHVKKRKMQDEIAEHLVQSNVDFFAGGGQKFFKIGEGDNDLTEMLRAKDFVINTQKLDVELPYNNANKYGYLLAKDGMPTMENDRGDFLKRASLLALECLSKNEKGFFLVIEGSQIDWGGHANNASYVISETLDFDQTVGAVLDFAKEDGNTLVIVTADHETGGFTLKAKLKKVPFGGSKPDYDEIDPSFSTGGHSAALVPVLAYGPGAEMFSGIYQNTAIHQKIVRLSSP